MFILEVLTREGKVCESFATYEEAKKRADQIPADQLAGIPFIFQELTDNSQRLVREDGKPLQWHRALDEPEPKSEEPIPLAEEVDEIVGKGWQVISRPPEEEWDDDVP